MDVKMVVIMTEGITIGSGYTSAGDNARKACNGICHVLTAVVVAAAWLLAPMVPDGLTLL